MNKKCLYLIFPLLLVGCGENVSSVGEKSIILSSDKYDLMIDEVSLINARTINFSGDVILESSDNSIVQVLQDNYIKALKEGNVTIKATSKDDKSVFASIDISVNNESDLIDFNYYKFDQYPSRNKSLNSLGAQNVLVLPISIKGFENNATENTLNRIKNAFNGETTWESVSSFYSKSSYNKLNFNFVVANQWYQSNLTPLEIEQRKLYDDCGTSYLVEDALNWYKENYSNDFNKYNKFDSNNDGFVDAIWAIYSAPNQTKHDYSDLINFDKTLMWAFTASSRLNLSNNGNLSSPVSKMFSWASYDFMDGYQLENSIDTHTYIHETGHQLGLKDYYCTIGNKDLPYPSPFGCIDMMDNNIGDHCGFSKYALGWIEPKVIKDEAIIDLKPFEESGDVLLLTNDNFNNTPFDEYFLVEYLTPTGLNQKDYSSYYVDNSLQGYSKNGVRISHVDNRVVSTKGGFHYCNNVDDFINDPFSNTNFTTYTPYVEEGGDRPMYQNTLMQKNYKESDCNIFYPNRGYFYSISYKNNKRKQNPDDSLFYEGESFSLEEDSPYLDLMPRKSNKLDKYGARNDYNLNDEEIIPDESDVFDYKIEVISLNDDYARIKITKIY